MKSNNNMRSTLRIACIELNTLFYSPVAWLVLVVFAFQVGLTFSSVMDGYIHGKVMDSGLYAITEGLFTGRRGLLLQVTNYLYLYVPLISMGLMSREFAGGSIKLLYSSPIRNSSIIFGKYLAVIVYGLVLMAILMCYVVYSAIVVENFDLPYVMSGMLGIFLLLCTYSAIGLFMSTITSYQVVAGVGTLALLAGLNYIGDVGQGIAFVRDITYWLSISGRTADFISGMIPSESVIYFLSLIVFFLCISIIKLNTDRAERNMRRTLASYGGAVLCLLAVAFVSSRPQCKFYSDLTYTQRNTLAEESLAMMEGLDGPMTITTYVNVLDQNVYAAVPTNMISDFKRFEKYTRFKPEIKMKYVYYWADCGNETLKKRYPDRTNAELADIVCRANGMKFKDLLDKEQADELFDLASEGYHFVRVVELGDGKQAILRMFDDTECHPGEAEISAAFKRFLEPSPRVAIISGHGDRTMDNRGSRGYNLFSRDLTFRNALVNQGFTPLELDLTQGDIPADIDIIVLADLKTPLSDQETACLDAYIARGGNMFLLGDVTRAATMNPIAGKLGLEFGHEVLVAPVKDQEPTILRGRFTKQVDRIYSRLDQLRRHGYRVALPGCVTVSQTGGESVYEAFPIVQTDSTGVWVERETVDFIEDSVTLNPAAGECEGVYTAVMALSRQVGDKQQRIVVSGDADCVSNEALSAQYWFSAANYSLIQGAFRWMSYDRFPIDTRHAQTIDNDISLGRPARLWNKIAMMGLFPGLLLFAGIVLIIKRQRG